jgi:regulator of sigma E protease
MTTILLFIIILGLLVFVHELGHFVAARYFGVKAEEFGFGFPPRMFGFVYDDTKKRYRYVRGKESVESPHTVYSLNWLPLGGFVRIKGEDGNETDADSFTAQSAWKRVTMLIAGVAMNFVAAIVLFGIVFSLGVRQPVAPEMATNYSDTQIQILQVVRDSSAQAIGLEPGDRLMSINGQSVTKIEEVRDILNGARGENITFAIERLGEPKVLRGEFTDSSEDAKFGIAYSHTATVKYSPAESVKEGIITTWHVTIAILVAFGQLIGGLFSDSKASGVDLTGPVGIVYITKQMSELGLVYILQFAALLSVNLAIINALPIPALDGGRILFIIIEKIKRSPVRRSTEGMIHQIGFLLLIFLMVFITTRDILKFELLQKITNLFT